MARQISRNVRFTDITECVPDMDNDVAKKLVVDGGTLVFLGVPAGTEFGIDMNVFNVGEKFRGVKMIPPGLHFVFYSAVSKEHSVAPRTGFFHWFNSGDVVVKKWNKLNEDIEDEDTNPDEVERLKANLMGDLDRYLGVYPYESWRKWISLTNFVNNPLMTALQPLNGKVSSVAQFIPSVYPPPTSTTEEPVVLMETEEAQRRPKKTMEERLLPDLKIQPGTEMRFTPIPTKRYPDGATPAEMTLHSLDSTYTLEQVMKLHINALDLLGELQLSFICFLIGQLYDAFEQWKELLHVLVTSDLALERYPELYLELISVLHFQIKEVPSDFFVDIVSSENFLTSTLSVLFKNMANSQTSGALKVKGEKFKDSLTKRFRWDFDLDDADEAPVIVDLGPEVTEPEMESENEQ